MRRALIAASFGTSVPEAETEIAAVEAALQAAAADFTLFRAYTSSKIRTILRDRGRPVPSPEETLRRLSSEGWEEVVIQPTHFLYGVEYGKLRETVSKFRPQFRSLRLGRPLLCGTAQMRDLASVLLRFSEPDEALVLMGHGTSGFSDIVYPAMETILRRSGGGHAYIAAVEGWPDFSEIPALLRGSGLRRVRLVPMMLTAGDHARRDMAGDSPGSWKSQLEAAGFSVRFHMHGLGSLPEVQQLYVRHLKELLEDGV